MQLEDILGGSFENDGDTYFNLSDCYSKFEGHQEVHQGLHEIDVEHTNSSCAGIDNSKDEHFFLHVFIGIFPRNVHFTFENIKLVIDCLQTQQIPIFEQIL